MTAREKIVGELLRDYERNIDRVFSTYIRETEEYYRLTIVNGACTAKGYFKTMDEVTETIIKLEALPDVHFEYRINKVEYDTAERCVTDIKDKWCL